MIVEGHVFHLCRFRKWFVTSMDGVRKHLLRKSQPEHLVFIGEERETGEFYPKMVSKLHPSSLHFSDVTPCTVEPRLTDSAQQQTPTM